MTYNSAKKHNIMLTGIKDSLVAQLWWVVVVKGTNFVGNYFRIRLLAKLVVIIVVKAFVVVLISNNGKKVRCEMSTNMHLF